MKAPLPLLSLNLLLLGVVNDVLLLPTPVASATTPPASSGVVLRNLARGSALKMLADLSGGLPFEVWKSSIVLDRMQRTRDDRERPSESSDLAILARVTKDRGIKGLWSGCPARMTEGFFSGAVLLAAKECLRKAMTASPVITRTLSPSAVGFLAGAGGGAAQAVVMAPCSLLVSATVANGGSVAAAARDVWSRRGIRGIYRGAPAVAARQATNWASRQGFTELIRPGLRIPGVTGEIVAGCLGGTVSCWNTPFEVARIYSQSHSFFSEKNASAAAAKGEEKNRGLVGTLRGIAKEQGVAGLYTGLVPRIGQACYQTVFLVCVPRILDS